MASGKLTADDSPEVWADAFWRYMEALRSSDESIAKKAITSWFHEAIFSGKAAGRLEERERQEGKVHIEGFEPAPEPADIWAGTPSNETDPDEWAREFMRLMDEGSPRGADRFSEVSKWFGAAIDAGANVAGTPLKTIEAMQAEVITNNIDKGWMDEPYSFGDCMVNLHGEISEAWEAWRKWGLEDVTGPQPLHASWCSGQHGEGRSCHPELVKPEGVGSEFADIFIRLLDDCERYGINLREEYERKMTYNRTRPYRHGDKRA